MNQKMLKYLLLQGILFISLICYSQNRMGSISGRVTDSKSQPIETALVLLKGTNISEYTNESG
jgi:hypothetical protein